MASAIPSYPPTQTRLPSMMSKGETQLPRTLLQSATFFDLLKFRQEVNGYSTLYEPAIICVHEDASIGETLSMMESNRRVALPIFQLMQSSSGVTTKSFKAIINVGDILTYGVRHEFFASASQICMLQSGSNELPRLQQQLEISLQDFYSRPIKECVGQTLESSRMLPFVLSDNLMDLVDVFKTHHRVLVSDPTSTWDDLKTTIVTQADFLLYISRNRKALLIDRALMNVTAQDAMQVGLESRTDIQRKLVTVSADLTALEAFRVMAESKVSALAVTNKSGVLIGNFAASNLEGFKMGRVNMLFLPVMKYLELPGLRGVIHDTLLTCSPDVPLLTVLDTLVDQKIHRVWVIDSAGLPLGAVTMTDIISHLTQRSAALEE